MKIKHPKGKGRVIKLEQKHVPLQEQEDPALRDFHLKAESGLRARDFYVLLLLVVSANLVLWLDSFDRYLSSRYHFYLAQYVPDELYQPSRELQNVLALAGLSSNQDASPQLAENVADDEEEKADEDNNSAQQSTAPAATPSTDKVDVVGNSVQQSKTTPAASAVQDEQSRLAMLAEARLHQKQTVTVVSGVVDVEYPVIQNASGVPDTNDRRPRVLFAGDSMMQGVAPMVIHKMRRAYPKGLYVDLSRQSTGLTVNRYFDWPAKIREECIKQGFRTVVVFLGPNDPWDIYEGKRRYIFPSDKWEEKYRSRVDEVMDFATTHGVHIIWVGLPVMRDTRVQNGVIVENKIFREEAQKYRFDFMPTEDLLGSVDAPYHKYIVDPKKGKVVVRADDGIHFSPNGLRLISARVEEFLMKQD